MEQPAEPREGMRELSVPRRFSRYPFQFPFLYPVPDTRPPRMGVGWTRQLSEGGAEVELGEPLSPGPPLTLLVQTARGPLELQAQVVWTGKPLEAGGGILHGLAFPAADPKLLQALRDLLQAQSGTARAGLRLPVAIPATCHSKDPPGPLLQGQTSNISREGLLLLLPEAMATGTVLAMTLDTPRGPVSLEGVIAWRDTPGIASPSKSVRHGVHLTSRDWATALALGHLVADLAGGRSLPEAARMAWKEIGPYRGHLLWVRELPTGDWLVGFVLERAGPAGASDHTPPPEDRVLPEAFGSEVAATAAAMQFLDRQQERRNAPQG